MPGRPWTSQERADLIRLRQDRVSIDDCAIKLGRSRVAIKTAIVRLDVPAVEKRPWTETERRDLIRLRQAGATRRQIARQLGRTEAAVCHQLVRLTITHRCRQCGQDKPAAAFAWSGRGGGIPLCKACAAARRPGAVTVTLATISPRALAVRSPHATVVGTVTATGPEGHQQMTLLENDDTNMIRCECGLTLRQTMRGHVPPNMRSHQRAVRADPVREARVVALAAQIAARGYQLPTFAQWLDKLDDPRIAGALIRDMLTEYKTSRLPKGGKAIGRTPSDFVTPAEVFELMPPVLLSALGLTPHPE